MINDDERFKIVFHKTTPELQDQDQDRFVWSQTGVALRPTVSDHITEIQGVKNRVFRRKSLFYRARADAFNYRYTIRQPVSVRPSVCTSICLSYSYN